MRQVEVALIPAHTRPFLDRIVNTFRPTLGDSLVGIYLHGSLAIGCFNPASSDIDFIVVVSEKLAVPTKRKIIAATLELAQDAPPKGLEFSVVLQGSTLNFTYPTPYELHYSQSWHAAYESGQRSYESGAGDPDLAAHFTIIRQRGVCLYGQPIDQVFAEVPPAYYWASILGDAQDILNDVAANPVYGVLNLCRVLAYKQDGLIASKVEGAEWALNNLDPRFHSLIRQALTVYQTSIVENVRWDNSHLNSFAESVKQLL